MDELLAMAFRFLTGRVLFRERTRWDARYVTPAPPIPDRFRLSPEEEYPRTAWARRPGYQRQFVRLTGLAILVAWLVFPVVVSLLAVSTLVIVAARRITRFRARRRHQAVVDPFDEPLAEQLGWGEVPTDEWIELPRGGWELAPLGVPRWLTPAGLGWLHRFRRGQRVARALHATAWWASCSPLRRPRRVPALPLSDADTRIRIHYPKTYNGHPENVKEAVRIVKDRLEGEWEHVHHPRKLMIELQHPQRWPESFEVTRDTFADYPLDEIPYAVTKSGEIDTIPLKAKTPHISLAASTGWGKTTAANVILGHLLSHGAYGMINDPKLVGYTHLVGLENVQINTTDRGMITAIRAVLEEMNRRYRIIEAYGPRAAELGFPSMKENPELYFRPVVLAEDEKGSFTVAVKSWWKRAPTEEWELEYKDGRVHPETGQVEGKPGKGDPKPLLDEQEILWRGRAAGVFVLTLAQQNNLFVFLNSDMRDQYMMRILYGPQTRSSWTMTFPGTRMKSMGSKKGRGIAGIGAEEQREILGGDITEAETRAAAEDGLDRAVELDQQRADRLAEVTGCLPWKVSPLAPWMHVQTRRPASTQIHVPEQRSVTGSEIGTGHGPQLTLIQGGGEQPEQAEEETDLEVIDGEIVDDDNTLSELVLESEPDPPEQLVEDTSQAQTASDRIVGMAGAAEYLGMNKDAFIQMRKRDKKKGVTIAGETTRSDGTVIFEPLALEEWRNQYHPRSARATMPTGTDHSRK